MVEDTVTSKQVTRIIEGRVAEIQDLYEPKTRDEALFCGHYHGTQCPKCYSWRTVLYLEVLN
jgi:hypothetical protein